MPGSNRHVVPRWQARQSGSSKVGSLLCRTRHTLFAVPPSVAATASEPPWVRSGFIGAGRTSRHGRSRRVSAVPGNGGAAHLADAWAHRSGPSTGDRFSDRVAPAGTIPACTCTYSFMARSRQDREAPSAQAAATVEGTPRAGHDLLVQDRPTLAARMWLAYWTLVHRSAAPARRALPGGPPRLITSVGMCPIRNRSHCSSLDRFRGPSGVSRKGRREAG